MDEIPNSYYIPIMHRFGDIRPNFWGGGIASMLGNESGGGEAGHHVHYFCEMHVCEVCAI